MKPLEALGFSWDRNLFDGYAPETNPNIWSMALSRLPMITVAEASLRKLSIDLPTAEALVDGQTGLLGDQAAEDALWHRIETWRWLLRTITMSGMKFPTAKRLATL